MHKIKPVTVKRTFILGDEWLYYKIYCGARTADSILAEAIKPLTAHLLQKGFITHWFFIRYNDPDFHLRLRFHLKDTRYLGDVVAEVYKALRDDVNDDVIHNVQAATYQREIERYGAATIAISEFLFWHESEMFLAAIDDDMTDEKLYFFFVLKAIDCLLSDFGYEAAQKSDLVSRNSTAFKEEFRADKKLKGDLGKKYKNCEKELSEFLGPDKHNKYKVFYQLLDDKTAVTLPLIREISQALLIQQEPKQNDLISSYIHMMVNRAFRSRQRFYELVCYDFLRRYYGRFGR